MTGSSIFCHKHKDTSIYTIKFHYQNEEVLGGLLLLAASSQPIGDLYERLGPSWSSGGKVEDWVSL